MQIVHIIVKKAPIAEMINPLEILKQIFSILEISQPHTILFTEPLVILVFIQKHAGSSVGKPKFSPCKRILFVASS